MSKENLILTRKELEKREHEWLAPYAMKSSDTLGRVHKENEHPYRSIYQRDKSRIIYSTAFRRLEYKTQVFVNHEGDYYRTRLTHTIEVTQIAKTIARALKLNDELAEVISLAHDLGHPPFGHAGEYALSDIMKEHGRFDHNTHGLRVVDVLEKRYPEFPGINLTNEVRRGILKHTTPFDSIRTSKIDIKGPWLLEIQVGDISDEIAYDNHDLDDGLKSGLITEKELDGIPTWEKSVRFVKKSYKIDNKDIFRSQVIRHLIDTQVSDVIEHTAKILMDMDLKCYDDLYKIKRRVVRFSDGLDRERLIMRKFLMKKLYKHYRVVRMSDKAARFLKALFNIYSENTQQLPPDAQDNVAKYGKYRAICDYIAGMTDRFALEQYKKFFEPYEKV